MDSSCVCCRYQVESGTHTGTTVRFWPEKSKVVEEFGEQEFTLDFEHDDLLTPTTQRNPPNLRKCPAAGDGCAAHRAEAVNEKAGEAKMPVFLQLRLRLV